MRYLGAVVLMMLCAAPAVRAERLWEKFVPLGLEREGDVATIEATLEQRAILIVFLQGPEEVVSACEITVRDPAGQALDISRMPSLAPGTYRVEVRARRDLAVSPTAQIAAWRALDPFDPNHTWEQAAVVSPPLREWILLERNLNDLFRIDMDEDGILSIQFTRPLGGPDIWFAFLDSERKEIWRTKERWDSWGARYFKVEKGKTYYMWVTPGNAATAWAEFELGLYRPGDLAPPEGAQDAGRILVVGLDPDSADLEQLRRISEAASKPLTTAVSEDVTTMTEELVRDVEIPQPRPQPEPEPPTARIPKSKPEEGGGGPGALLWIVLVLAAAGSAVALVAYRRRNAAG